MAIKSVADSPAIANISAEVARVGGYARKIPVRYYRFALIALALIWMVHTIASVFWVLFPPPALPVAEVKPATIKLDTSSRQDVSVAGAQELNLFGDYGAQPEQEPEPVQQEQLEVTKLNLELQGVIASNDPAYSSAIIGKGNEQKLYKIGDEIEGARGVKIHQVYDLKVVLNNNGNLEELWLFGEDGKKFATSSAPPPRSTPSRPEPASATIRPEQIRQARNIGDVVRFMVATEGGKMIGYKVRPGRQRELFDQVGLKTDDIVVSVNGIEVNEPQKVREVYQSLKSATEANLQVLRDGTTHSIQITMSSEG